MILTFDAYAIRMSAYWHKTVTPDDYARYVLETVQDLARAERAEREIRTNLDY